MPEIHKIFQGDIPAKQTLEFMQHNIKELAEIKNKLDDHFGSFNKKYAKHEYLENTLIKLSSERMDKIDKMMMVIKDDYENKYIHLVKKMKWVFIGLFFAYVLIMLSFYL